MSVVAALLGFLLVALASACTATDAQALEGFLENIDSANGEIVIVTKDGKTLRLTLVTEVNEPVQTGDFVEVQVDEDERVTSLKNRSKQTTQGFAEDCNDDGKVDLQQDLKVEGGQGALTRACQVSLADETKLEIIKATITGSTDASLDIEGGRKSELILDEATLDMGAGILRFTSGDEGVVVAAKSTLVGNPVDLGAAQASGKGQMQVSDSEVRSSGQDVILRASESGREGQVQVSDSVLVAASNIRIVTGQDGQTQASKNQFNAGSAVTIAAGAGGQCQSQDNTPSTPCRP
ncbi:MAG: hypothetical protein L0177_19560 [Chloroflexi bacterium]|nr:hypothetical protein [Chloroflexota bacterium]